METPPFESEQKLSEGEDTSFDNDQSSDTLNILPDRLAEFFNLVNGAAGTELFDNTEGIDTLGALLGVYKDTHTEPQRVDGLINRIMDYLQGKSLSDIAKEAGIDRENIVITYESAATIIAREVKIIRDSRVDIRLFSPHDIEAARKQINNKVGEPFFSGPLEEDEIEGIIELYIRKRLEGHPKDIPKPDVLNRHILVLRRRLEGKSRVDIAEETGLTLTNLDNSYSRILKRIRQELHALPNAPLLNEPPTRKRRSANIPEKATIQDVPTPETASVDKYEAEVAVREKSEEPRVIQQPANEVVASNRPIEVDRTEEQDQLDIAINTIIYDGNLPPINGRLLKHHLGIIILPSYGVRELKVTFDACEQIRKLLDNKAGASRNEISKVTQDLLGDRRNGRVPIPRNQLARQYKASHDKAGSIIQYPVDYEQFIDRSFLEDLRRHYFHYGSLSDN